MRALIERERTREAALEASIQDYLRDHRKYRLVERRRIVAVVGHHAMVGGYDFKVILVDEKGEITIRDEPSPTVYLIRQFKEAGK
jgi:RecB family exonuclease